MHKCDRYLAAMNLLAVREALRLLRVQADKSLDEIPGLNRSTVHRIENVKGDRDYSPELLSVGRIVEACGSTLAEFFTRLDALRPVMDQHPELLTRLADEETARQVLAFLDLPIRARRALAASAPDPAPALTVVSIPAPTDRARTTPPPKKHRSSGPRKTGT